MEEKLCDIRHRRIDEKLEDHSDILKTQDSRLDRIEFSTAKLEERLDGLIKQLSSLTTTLKWFIGLMVGSFVAFFFYAVQQGLFK